MVCPQQIRGKGRAFGQGSKPLVDLDTSQKTSNVFSDAFGCPLVTSKTDQSANRGVGRDLTARRTGHARAFGQGGSTDNLLIC